MIAPSHRIEPFAGLIYNQKKSGPLEQVLAPPYDLIDRARQDELYARSPYNVIRLELNREPDRYEASAATLRQWLAQGVLERLPQPACFLYTQRFNHEGQGYKRQGLIVRLQLEDFKPGRILPHERTFSAPKEDRLRLLQATQVNTSSIFALYPGSAEIDELLADVAQRGALMQARDDIGTMHEIRLITQPVEIQLLQEAFEQLPLLIADGHHRYATALNYRAQRRAANADAPGPYDYTMMTLVADDDPGLLILPTHRVLRHLDPAAVHNFTAHVRQFFALEEYDDADRLMERLRQGERGMLGVALRGEPRLWLLALRDPAMIDLVAPGMNPELRKLDVTLLHSLVFKRLLGIDEAAVRTGSNIEYTIDARAALVAVGAGQAAGAFLLNPPSVADLKRVGEAGETMPEKSTYFFPKLITGLVMNPLGD
ncbi:MAG TPA: DUF1015 domain-containing protein [Candidatus Binataceae bacterium]|nr:DUF1015 domain-containing protein [Candidatus Binataceae bacterium]